MKSATPVSLRASVSLQVVHVLLNIASHYKCVLHTVHARFTLDDKPIYLCINKNIVPNGFLKILQQLPHITEHVIITGQVFIWVKTVTL